MPRWRAAVVVVVGLAVLTGCGDGDADAIGSGGEIDPPNADEVDRPCEEVFAEGTEMTVEEFQNAACGGFNAIVSLSWDCEGGASLLRNDYAWLPPDGVLVAFDETDNTSGVIDEYCRQSGGY
jgi:hypothetical protein